LALKSGMYPLFEAENGVLVESTPIEDPVPVEEYLRVQKRFAHLFGKRAIPENVGILQKIANRNIEKYRLGGMSNE
jgi:pyruvate ferredoxin oxidoreductase beta subunit